MKIDCLFFNNKIQKNIMYNGFVYEFFANCKMGEKYRIFGVFKKQENSKIFCKNIPKSSILALKNHYIIDYSFKANEDKKIYFFLYICTKRELSDKLKIDKFIKILNEEIVSYYRKLFNTKIYSCDKKLDKMFNVTLPKHILCENADLNYNLVKRFKNLSPLVLEKLYLNSNINSKEFYYILKTYKVGVVQTDLKLTIKPTLLNLFAVKVDDFVINIQYSLQNLSYLEVDNVKYYNFFSLQSKLKDKTNQITLVI